MKRLIYFLILTLPILSLFSCQNKSKSSNAEVGKEQEVPTTNNASAMTFKIDTSENPVHWVGRKLSGQHNGTFGVKEGNFSIANGEIIGGKVVIDLTDINVLDLEGEYKDKLTTHLKSEDFFDVKNYPMATFEITKVSPSSAKIISENDTIQATHEVTGNLTMHGKTYSISFPAKVDMKEHSLNAKATFVIDRTQWGVSYHDESSFIDKAKDNMILNDVEVSLDLTASHAM